MEIAKSNKISSVQKRGLMLRPTKENLKKMKAEIEAWKSFHDNVTALFAKFGQKEVFESIEAMKVWYCCKKGVNKLKEHRATLSRVMLLDPKWAVGLYRGLTAKKGTPLASVKVGDEFDLPTIKNGVSSWTTSIHLAGSFASGYSQAGIIVELIDPKGVVPLVAPPSHTVDFFNKLYREQVGSNRYRKAEDEYLLASKKTRVRVVWVKPAEAVTHGGVFSGYWKKGKSKTKKVSKGAKGSKASKKG
jgi:hypothetical protein